MPIVGKRVSFSVVIALLLGWGALSLFVLKTSDTLFTADTYSTDHPVALLPGVKLTLQVDKRVYRSGDDVLIALRNDSRPQIWLSQHADGCASSWWRVERLADDGETWSAVPLSKDVCVAATYGLEKFTSHTLKTADWIANVPSTLIGNITTPAPAGTYRISVPYLKAVEAKEEDWHQGAPPKIVSPSFSLQ